MKIFSTTKHGKKKMLNKTSKISYVQAKLSAFLTLLCLLQAPLIGYGQEAAERSSTNAYLLKAAKEIIAATGVCTLITLDEEGRARARAMDAFLPDENFIIWFGTNPKSRKVKQIQHDARVTLYYFDKATASYVMLYGKAEIVDSADEKRQHWKKEWSAFYPNFPEGFLLIKFTPDWMEVVSVSRGINGDTITWQPATFKF